MFYSSIDHVGRNDSAVSAAKTERQVAMEKRQRVQSSPYSPNRLQNRLLLGLIALVVMASLAAPARAQYQYAQQAPMMAVSAASGLFRASTYDGHRIGQVSPTSRTQKQKQE